MTSNPGDLPHDSPNEKSDSWLPILEGLIENTEWNRDLIEHSHDLLCIHDLKGKLLSVNPRPAQLLGYTVEELLRLPMRDLFPPEFRPQFDQYLEKISRDGEAHGLLAVNNRSGEKRTWEYHNKLHRSEGAEPVVHGIAYDVTEQKRLRHELRKSEEQVRLFIGHAPAALAMFDREMRYLHASRCWRDDFGLGDRDLRGLSHYDHFPEIPERWKEAHRRGLAGEVLREDYDRLDRPDGSCKWVRWEIRPWYDKAGAIGGIVIFSEDLTERERAATALEESERRFRAVYERAPVGIALMDLHTGRFLQVNPKYCDIVGRTEAEMLRLHFQDITHPEDKARSNALIQQLIEEKIRDYDLEKRYLRPDGRTVWVNLSIVPMWIQGEEARWHIAIVQDITERKMAEDSLRTSEERLRLAHEVAQIGTFDQNLVSGECRCTPQLEMMYGLQPGTFPLTSERYLEVIHPNDRKRMSELIGRAMQTGEGSGEWRVVWPDGSVHWIAGRWRVCQDAGGKPVRVIAVNQDVTHRKRVERELRLAKERLTEEKLYLEHEINTEFGFEEIVGHSAALKAVMENVSRVAASDATVLLLGETGVGKELVARAIHRLSQRAGKAFIKMNCAAIPSGLLESELFGAEKGAFTGSTSRKIGRLELADKGTLFLDEIGEIALSLQPKLLRVLQDQEFERLGGTHTIKVNFRLIAASNRDLAEDVQRNQFRSDLFYRLNVFPIQVPPLRDRQDDIPLLVEHFVRKCAQRMGKSITSIPKKTMEALMAWHWPGNIRELENFIERSVILTNGSVLAAPLSELQSSVALSRTANETLHAAERRHILEALRQSDGRISGQKGAAARLGLKRTTLQSKLKQMGINPRMPPAN